MKDDRLMEQQQTTTTTVNAQNKMENNNTEKNGRYSINKSTGMLAFISLNY